jgi:acetolactate synthase-1/2/3 large subunit
LSSNTTPPGGTQTVAQSYLQLLSQRGIDYLFANAGTDFAPLIEAYAAAGGQGMPTPVTVPHENVAIHMAMGHWLVSHRMQAVMVHVSVGTANAVCGVLNAARCHIPVLFTAGRTPITESGAVGSRNIHIHWTQEMFDQASMVREVVKWEYELRTPRQLATVVDRAFSIANSAPKGPVYLTLPREVLATHIAAPGGPFAPSRQGAALSAGPGPAALDQMANLFVEALFPVIITTGMALEEGADAVLARFADEFAVPVVQFAPRCANLPTDHPMHAGYDVAPWIEQADLIIVLDSVVPWIPERTQVSHAQVIHVGADPLHSNIPIRGFECDLAVTSSPAAALAALTQRLGQHQMEAASEIEERRQRVQARIAAERANQRALVEKVRDQVPIHPVWLSHCINTAKGQDALLVKETGPLSMAQQDFGQPSSFLYAGGAAGLGWGLGVALGAKLAAPDKLVIAVEGDGSYMFCTPVAAHYVALEQDAPFLTIILNNQRWNEVRSATRHVYPNGVAAQPGAYEPLTHFHPSLRLHKVVESAGGYGERVTDPAELPAALARAIAMVRDERRQVVLDVVCSS